MTSFQKSIIAFVLFLSIYPAILFAGNGTREKEKTIQEQIAAYISYPNLLSRMESGVVTVSFRLTGDSRITGVEAQSGIAEIDTFLEQTLSGKRIKMAENAPAARYRIRIRFRSA